MFLEKGYLDHVSAGDVRVKGGGELFLARRHCMLHYIR